MRCFTPWLFTLALSAGEPAMPANAGGMLVWLGPASGEQLVALGRAHPALVVQALLPDAAAAQAANQALHAGGMLGRMRAEVRRPGALPQTEHSANLVVLAAGAGDRAEAERICAPGGAVLDGGLTGAAWTKPVPAEMDVWTHLRHGADRVPMSRDRLVGPPQALQWLDGPLYLEALCAVGSGCLFTVWMSEVQGPQGKTNQLTCRDAFNGVVRWQRAVPFDFDKRLDVRPGHGWGGGYATGHMAADAIVLDGDRIYVAEATRVLALNARTGAELGVFATSGKPYQITVAGGRLVAATSTGVEAFALPAGTPAWQQPGRAFDLTVAGDRVYWTDSAAWPITVHCHALADGAQRWAMPTGELYPTEPKKRFGRDGYTPIRIFAALAGHLIITVGVDAQHGGQSGNPAYSAALIGLGLDDGAQRWRYDATKDPKEKIRPQLAPVSNLVVTEGVLWAYPAARLAIDPATGKELHRFGSAGLTNDHCQYSFGTPTHIVSKSSTWFDAATGEKLPRKGENSGFLGITGTCGSPGGLPGYGLMFMGAKNCSCATWGHGLRAGLPFARAGGEALFQSDEHPVERSAPVAVAAVSGWPQFGGDARRSFASATALPTTVAERWQTPIATGAAGGWSRHAGGGDRVSAPVIAQGLAVAADAEGGAVIACDAASGAVRWRWFAGGRIDGPPAIAGDAVVCGSVDGWLSAVGLADGVLRWRVRLAGAERRITEYGQAASFQPIAGPVLADGDRVWAMTGRFAGYAERVRVHEVSLADGAVRRSRGCGPRAGTLAVSEAGSVVLLRDWIGGHRQAIGDLFAAPPAKADKNAKPEPPPPNPTWHMTHAMPLHTPPLSVRISSNLSEQSFVELGDGKRTLRFDYLGGELRCYDHAALRAAVGKVEQGRLAPLWKLKSPPTERIEAALIAGGQVWYAGSIMKPGGRDAARPAGPGFLAAVGLADGKPITRIDLPAGPTFQGLAVADGRLYLAGDDGVLRAYGR